MQILPAILLTSLFVVTGCSDVVESRHANIAAAKSDIDRGWIPAILPASTVQIRESHNIDTNIGHGTFGFGASDAEQFRSVLTVLPPNDPIRRVRIPREQMERKGFSFYRHDDFYIAVDWSRRRGEFWLAYSR
jgi:hypothetical protein